MQDTLLSLQHISKNFGEGDVLRDISLDVARGEFVTLLGASGCGKTTTLRIISGLETPDEGTVLLDGRDVTALPPERRPVNTVFQSYALFPHMNVYDNIAYGLKIQKISKDIIDQKVMRMLKLIGLEGYEKRDVTLLSGGQQQRVAIARAVVTECKLLLADEPTGNLDSVNGIEVMELLSELNRQGTTIIIVTHSQRDAKYAHRVIQLLDGQIVAENINRPLEKKTSSKNETV